MEKTVLVHSTISDNGGHEMRRFVKWLLFGSSYSPLLIILILKNINAEGWSRLYNHPFSLGFLWHSLDTLFQSPWLSYGLLAFALLANIFMLTMLHDVKTLQPSPHKVVKVTTKSGESLNYIVTYIIPFLSLEATKTTDVLALGILLLVMALIYVNSSLIHTNPMLSIFGYKIYEIETVNTSVIVITRKNRAKKNTTISLIHLDDDIYMEA